jgi:hypothetical protein
MDAGLEDLEPLWKLLSEKQKHVKKSLLKLRIAQFIFFLVFPCCLLSTFTCGIKKK